ncbi:MAG: cytochrome c [Gemmataceae bacterium]|nr:cytochrome c [Gemmataceae bacterium]
MRVPRFPPNRLRSAALAALAVVLSGCGAGGCGRSTPEYPSEIVFETRADRLVLQIPTTEPTGFGKPERWAEDVAGLDALGGRTVDPKALPAAARDALQHYLTETFNTPGEPRVADAEAAELAARLGLTPDRLREGGKLFFDKCVLCHGVAGDGRGPNAQWLNPHPRDFRQGRFKFVTTGDGGRPRKADLMRTIRDGLKGTAMPNFTMLPEHERDLLAGYVTFLSVRGEVEFRTLEALAREAAGEEADPDPGAKLRAVLRAWDAAEHAPPTPADPLPDDDATRQTPAYQDSVRRGYELFSSPAGLNCMACHQDFGRKPTYRYDVWGTVARPADLTGEVLKAGNGSEALYWRVRGGIQPVGMPAHPTLTDAQVWDVVRFVRALPYRVQLPADVRAKVYPE